MPKEKIKRNGTKYKVVEETENEDGTIVIKILKQYNSYETGDYIE